MLVAVSVSDCQVINSSGLVIKLLVMGSGGKPAVFTTSSSGVVTTVSGNLWCLDQLLLLIRLYTWALLVDNVCNRVLCAVVLPCCSLSYSEALQAFLYLFAAAGALGLVSILVGLLANTKVAGPDEMEKRFQLTRARYEYVLLTYTDLGLCVCVGAHCAVSFHLFWAPRPHLSGTCARISRSWSRRISSCGDAGFFIKHSIQCIFCMMILLYMSCFCCCRNATP